MKSALRRATLLLLGFAFASVLWAQETHPANALEQQDKPYVLLISLDGFRYDYAQRYHARNLLELGKQGVAAKALVPSFPTTTFPNHYTIVTGLYPGHHGIVENIFWDPEKNAQFKSNEQASISDSSWWRGAPIWVLAEQQGMRAASFFWPGSDVEIQHTRPTYYYPYDGQIPYEQRIEQVLSWLKLPKAQRPHFITLYFSEVDHQGHLHGPDAPETEQAVQMEDRLLGKLFGELRGVGVPINIFVVSDHGMATVTGDIDISKLADLDGVTVTSEASDYKFYSRDPAKVARLYEQLKGKDPRYEIYKRDEIPAQINYSSDPRVGDLLMLPVQPIMLHRKLREGQTISKGMHGFPAEWVPDMRGIFYARGPDLKSGVTIEEFRNIHIYPLITEILGLKTPAGIDGQLSVLSPILKAKP